MAILGCGILPRLAVAVPTVYTVESDYLDAIALIDAAAIFGLEDFNSSAVGDLGAGPTAFTGFDLTLNAIGTGGSFTGIINPGEFDTSNAFEGRVVFSSQGIELFPGFFLDGEGVEGMDFAFTEPGGVIGFAADWNSTTGNDNVQMNVNGTDFDFGTLLPDTNLDDGNGFLGIVDPDLIGSFSLFAALEAVLGEGSFEDFELDNLQFATPNPIPAPASVWLGMMGFGVMGWVKRRSA